MTANSHIPGEQLSQEVALISATIYPLSSPAIEDGVLVMKEGRIVSVGKNMPLSPETRRIDVSGQSIYPGLINLDGLLGLIEINAVRATGDDSETGESNPNVRAETAVNPDSELIPVTRSGGVLFSLATPRRGRVSGTSALLQLEGWTWEEMTVKSPVGMHVRRPNLDRKGAKGGGHPLGVVPALTVSKQMPVEDLNELVSF